MIKRRPYQSLAIETLFGALEETKQNQLVLMPTATGKSVVLGGFAMDTMQRWRGMRIVNATHVKELIGQNYAKFCQMWPGAPAGICSAGLKRWETHYPVTFGGIDTLINYVEDLGFVDVLIIDECHLVGDKDEATYLRFINKLRDVNPKLKVIGFTATGWRQGMGMLTNGKIFQNIAVDMTTMEWFDYFIDNRFLVKPIIPEQDVTMNLDGIVSVNGDFKQSEAETRAMQITNDAIANAMKYASSRRKWLSFGSGVEHAIYISEQLNKAGIKSGVVHSNTKNNPMSDNQRDDTLQALREGYLQNVANYGVLTTGFDDPEIDLIFMLRATKISSLWVQMIGRGMRTSWETGKLNCLVLDHGTNCRRLGPINDPIIPKLKGKRAGDAPIKACDNCRCQCHISARFCDGCGEPFIFDVKFKERAGNAEIMRTADAAPPINRYEVSRVYYSRHIDQKKGLAHFKVQYVTSENRYISEMIHLETPGRARVKAAEWWSLRTSTPCPATVDEALQMVAKLEMPTHITVNEGGDWPSVIGYEYALQSA